MLSAYPPANPDAQVEVSATQRRGLEKAALQVAALLKHRAAQGDTRAYATHVLTLKLLVYEALSY